MGATDFLAPQAAVSPEELDRGIAWLMWDAAFASAVVAVNSGVVLVAFALQLGASNLVIGILAAAPFWTQLLQAPTVSLVERLRRRRLIAVGGLTLGRLMLLPLIVLPFLDNRPAALAILIAAIGAHYALNAMAACAWNSWMRDLIPDERMGSFFASRSSYVAAVTLVLSLAVGLAIDRTQTPAGKNAMFSAFYIVGFLAGMVSCLQLGQAPEPRMEAATTPMHLSRLLKLPLRDQNFRRLIIFLSSWQFAVNLATPFLTVYFVKQLGFGLTFVLALTAISQTANLVVLRSWGALSDRFSNKSVLAVSAPVFIGCIAAMVLASQLTDRWMLGAFLAVLHVFMGMASAGVGLASGNIALKLAPRGSATVYVATSSLITSAAAGAAPILGGLFADFFSQRKLTLALQWSNPNGVFELLPLQLSHWDFYFAVAAVLGLYALHRLSLVREEGEVENREMVQQMLLEARRTVRNLSPVAGLRLVSTFPSGLMIELQRLRTQGRRQRIKIGKAKQFQSGSSPPHAAPGASPAQSASRRRHK